MTFRVGQKVVCIRHRDGAGRPGANYPKVGPIYTVRSINDEPKGAIICLEEIDNAHLRTLRTIIATISWCAVA
jgi:hypothetical protein